MSSCVLFDVKENGVGYVILNRPSTYNSFNREMFTRIASIIDELSTRTDVRLVIIRGAGGNFSSGLDLMDVMGNLAGASNLLEPWAPHEHNLAQHVCVGWRLLPMPVIAVVEGVAFGAGLQLALGADIRLCAEDSRWAVLEGKWGLVPDMGISITARNTVRADVLRTLTLTAAIVPGSRAVELGLATEAYPAATLQERVDTLTQDLLQRTAHALRLGKRMLWDPRGQWMWQGAPASGAEHVKEGDGGTARAWGAWVAGRSDYARLREEMKAQVELLGGAEHKALVRAALGSKSKSKSKNATAKL